MPDRVPDISGTQATRQVVLRDETTGLDSRRLWAYLDASGNLHIDGQDLGPGTAIISSDGEYEWFNTIQAEHVPQLVNALGGAPGVDVLDLLAERYTGESAAEPERIMRKQGIPYSFYSC